MPRIATIIALLFWPYSASTTLAQAGVVGFGVGEKGEFHFEDLRIDAPSVTPVTVALRYHYDVQGRVVGRTLNPGKPEEESLFYIYDGARIAEQVDGDGDLVAAWDYGPYIDEPVAMHRDITGDGILDATWYYLHDDIYNVVGLVDAATDAVVERYSYDDYGMPTVWVEDAQNPGAWIEHTTVTGAPASAIGNPFMFTGRRWDPQLRLYDYRTRYYDPALGRFLRRDTIGLYGDPTNLGNPYTYVGNNPWTHTDPWGLSGDDLDINDYPALNEEAFRRYQSSRGRTPGIQRNRWIDAISLGSHVPEGNVTTRNIIGENPRAQRGVETLAGVAAASQLTVDDAHAVLDALGMAPGVGAIFDVANGVWYLVEGDRVNGVISIGAAVPGAGDLAGAAKILGGGAAIKAGIVIMETTVRGKKFKYAAKAADVAVGLGRSVDTMQNTARGAGAARRSLYHYTSSEAADSIAKQGLRPGRDGFVYVTPEGSLSPIQANIELALPTNRVVPDAILEIDVEGLSRVGINPVSGPRRVQGNLPGLGAGGGTELLYDQPIPPEFIRRVR